MLRHLAKVNQRLIHGQRTKVLLMATNDRLPCYLAKDVRATDSCFAIIGAHQCGVPVVNAGWLAASASTSSETHAVSTETVEAISQNVWLCALQAGIFPVITAIHECWLFWNPGLMHAKWLRFIYLATSASTNTVRINKRQFFIITVCILKTVCKLQSCVVDLDLMYVCVVMSMVLCMFYVYH